MSLQRMPSFRPAREKSVAAFGGPSSLWRGEWCFQNVSMTFADSLRRRTLTLKLNRPRSVDPEIITVPLPQPMQALDSSQSFDNSPHQAANARLTLILDKLADTSYEISSSAVIPAHPTDLEYPENGTATKMSRYTPEHHSKPGSNHYRRI